MHARIASLSLLWKVMLATSIAITLLFAITGWVVQEQFFRGASHTLEEEIRASFQAYESLWHARADQLASVSLVLSRMSDVRAAFGTGDQATIRDSAAEIWSKIADEDAIFLVTDPRGVVVASLGGDLDHRQQDLEIVRAAAGQFPNQASGFQFNGGRLYQTVITPVYVASTQGSALLNVLVAGYVVDGAVARRLRQATGGSDFVFVSYGDSPAVGSPQQNVSGRKVVASSLENMNGLDLRGVPGPAGELPHVEMSGSEYAQFSTPLLDVRGKPIGEVRILRSFDAGRHSAAALRQRMIAIWLVAVLGGLSFTFLLTRRILRPVQALDAAAAEIGRGNYDVKVNVHGDDELGRLARTFNDMCLSIKKAREEALRQERLATISRLSSSIVHDLRNPLAAIYGGAEMLVDDELPSQQVKRLATNIYKSSRRVQDLLSDLSDVTRGRTHGAELCRLDEIVSAAAEAVVTEAGVHGVSFRIDVPPAIHLMVERSRMERVFENLFANAITAMPSGGSITVAVESSPAGVTVSVTDTGHGLSPVIAGRLFEPFVTEGKQRGMGLGLALSRETVRDHGGDLWLDGRYSGGARFLVRLPLVRPVS